MSVWSDTLTVVWLNIANHSVLWQNSDVLADYETPVPADDCSQVLYRTVPSSAAASEIS
jgi:hypothetical protein